MGILNTTRLQFVARHEEEGGVHSFAFKPLGTMEHTAGQHGLLTLPGVGTKPLSIASAPEDDEVVIGTRVQSGSAFKRRLMSLEPGENASLRGPLMNFTLTKAPTNVVLLTQGVGVTPFRSMLRHVNAASLGHRTTLIHVGNGHAYRAETEELATTAYFPEHRDGFHDAVTERLATAHGARYYVSGGSDFVNDTVAALSNLGIGRKQIRKATFTGIIAEQTTTTN